MRLWLLWLVRNQLLVLVLLLPEIRRRSPRIEVRRMQSGGRSECGVMRLHWERVEGHRSSSGAGSGGNGLPWLIEEI